MKNLLTVLGTLFGVLLIIFGLNGLVRDTAQAQSSSHKIVGQVLSAANTAGCNTSGTGCAVISTDGFRNIGVSITGTFTGTLNFECSMTNVADTASWFATVMTLTSNHSTTSSAPTAAGYYEGTCTGSRFRVRASAMSSNSATVSIIAVQ